MKKQLLSGFVMFVLLFIAGCGVQNQDGQAALYTPPSSLTPEARPQTTNTSVPTSPRTSTPSPALTTKNSPAPLYVEYTLSRYTLNKGKQPQVLFFQTATCLTCKKLNTDILAKLPTFPRGTQILKVDFNKESTLLKSFGITTKGTIVVLDKSGKVTAKLVNPTIDQLLIAIKKVLS